MQQLCMSGVAPALMQFQDVWIRSWCSRRTQNQRKSVQNPVGRWRGAGATGADHKKISGSDTQVSFPNLARRLLTGKTASLFKLNMGGARECAGGLLQSHRP